MLSSEATRARGHCDGASGLSGHTSRMRVAHLRHYEYTRYVGRYLKGWSLTHKSPTVTPSR